MLITEQKVTLYGLYTNVSNDIPFANLFIVSFCGKGQIAGVKCNVFVGSWFLGQNRNVVAFNPWLVFQCFHSHIRLGFHLLLSFCMLKLFLKLVIYVTREDFYLLCPRILCLQNVDLVDNSQNLSLVPILQDFIFISSEHKVS